jgi:hypothetical protein
MLCCATLDLDESSVHGELHLRDGIFQNHVSPFKFDTVFAKQFPSSYPHSPASNVSNDPTTFPERASAIFVSIAPRLSHDESERRRTHSSRCNASHGNQVPVTATNILQCSSYQQHLDNDIPPKVVAETAFLESKHRISTSSLSLAPTKLAPQRPNQSIAKQSLPLPTLQLLEMTSGTNPCAVPILIFGAIFSFAAASVRLAMRVLQCVIKRKIRHQVLFSRPHSVGSVMSAVVCFSLCLHVAAAADIVSVDPSKGQDTPACSLSPPCQTISYALRARQAASLRLSEGTFHETSIYVDSIAHLLSVSGSRDNTVIDCGGKGPAFIIFNTSISIVGVAFKNCVNFIAASGNGGAISAVSSAVVVNNCAFFNNTAQTGGAIGAVSGSLIVQSSLFESNTATCSNISTACSPWGGAIGAVDVPSVAITNNNFSHNTATLELVGVRVSATSAAAGGGCLSILYNSDISGSRVSMDKNVFQSCSVRMFGTVSLLEEPSGVQCGNAYGGAVSFYYGFRSASSLQIYDTSCSFTNNICHSTSIAASVGIGGNVYGGCLSVYAGAWRVTETGSSSLGHVTVERMSMSIVGNSLVDSRASSSSSSPSSSNGANSYGGGISVAVGAYVYGRGLSTFRGNTIFNNNSIAISGNTLTDCEASSSSSSPSPQLDSFSNGLNAYGGGISFSVGAYTYGTNSIHFRGDTTFNNIKYTMSRNSLINCTASSLTSSLVTSSSFVSSSSSNGANSYGGGISIAMGAYVFGRQATIFQGDTSISNCTYSIESNILTNCTASSSTIRSSESSSFGANAYGGGISLVTGVYIFGADVRATGGTKLSSSHFFLTSNMLTYCISSSFTSSSSPSSRSFKSYESYSVSQGANVYGGGISLVFGAYVYGRGRSIFEGNTIFNYSSCNLSNLTLIRCESLSSRTSSSSSSIESTKSISSIFSYGSNAYGGGMSLAVGAYVFGGGGVLPFIGDTIFNNSSCIISNNTLTHCTASSLTSSSSSTFFQASSSSDKPSSYGASAFGGGISFAVGSYVCGANGYFYQGSVTIRNSSNKLSGNILTNCTALSSTSSFSSSHISSRSESASVTWAMNSYGGGISLAVGSYVYGGGGKFTGDTTFSYSSNTISDNMLINCAALLSTSSSSSSPSSSYSILSTYLLSSNGANAYGGGISIVMGAYVFGGGFVTFQGDTTLSISRYSVSRNMLTNCTASTSSTFFTSSSSGSSSSSSSSNGLNSYGGGISIVVGSYIYTGTVLVFTGNTTVSDSIYTVSSNTLKDCIASTSSSSSRGVSLTSSPSCNGANAYGGGVSLAVGPYIYGKDVAIQKTDCVIISMFNVEISNFSSFRCFSTVVTSGISSEALSFGGAVSAVFEAYIFPKKPSDTSLPIVKSSKLLLTKCNISQSISSSCGPGANSAAGGAIFVSSYNVDVIVSSSVISYSSVRTGCATMSSKTYSLGGSMSVFQARDVTVDSTNILYCVAVGVPQANDVFVSGGGIFVQASESLTLESSFVVSCSVEDAFSVRILTCGGGGMGTKNVHVVRISNSTFYNNSDSSLTAVILLQQLDLESGMVINITNRSALSTDPSISVTLPVLNISCGLNCSIEQQQRLRLNVLNSSLLAQNPSEQPYQSALVMSLPRWSPVFAANSFLNCSFKGADNIAVIIRPENNLVVATCAPCAKAFSIAMASRSMPLSQFSSYAVQSRISESCRPLFLKTLDSFSDKEQQCPFGFSFCSTIAIITVGFWTNFSADGSISNAIRCPSNYCGCRNIPGYSQPTCRIFPLFAVEHQPDDALCSNNRTGMLCGACKSNYTQSLNGYSCVPNDVCVEKLPLVWALTVTGYIVFSVYIVVSTMTINSGFITCVLFYGQLASFASLPSQLVAESEKSEISLWFSKVSQFSSILSFYDDSCYGLGMGAYEAIAAQLIGPFIVLFATLPLTAAAKQLLLKLDHFCERHNVNISISYGATIINVLLLVFSSVSSVVFQLITCRELGAERVVFIDGTKKCDGPLHRGLVAVAALLSFVPVVFFILLKRTIIPATVKAIVCSAYNDSRYYWSAIALFFRFLMTVLFATASEFPSVMSLVLLVCSIFMLVLLIMLRPYVEQRSYYMDIFCYICLTVQFALQGLVRTSESLGFAVAATNSFRPVLFNVARVSNALRCV